MNRLNSTDSSALANLLCLKLASDLDAKDTSSVNTIGYLLAELPLDAVLIALRLHIGIERIVAHSLDENKSFNNIIKNLGKNAENFGAQDEAKNKDNS